MGKRESFYFRRMKLHLVRHGKAEKFSNSGKDFDRDLAQKGIKQSQMLGKHLQEKGLAEDIAILCSSANRTVQTLESIRKHINFKNINYQNDLYLCGKDDLLNLLWGLNNNQDLLIIGHNFGISDFGQYFIDDFLELRTGEYICIEFDASNWKETSQGMGVIADLYRASVDL